MTKVGAITLSTIRTQQRRALKIKQQKALEEKERLLEEKLNDLITQKAKEIMPRRKFFAYTVVNNEPCGSSCLRTVQDYSAKGTMKETEWAPWSICYKNKDTLLVQILQLFF